MYKLGIQSDIEDTDSEEASEGDNYENTVLEKADNNLAGNLH